VLTLRVAPGVLLAGLGCAPERGIIGSVEIEPDKVGAVLDAADISSTEAGQARPEELLHDVRVLALHSRVRKPRTFRWS